jgi:hypothetical protein
MLTHCYAREHGEKVIRHQARIPGQELRPVDPTKAFSLWTPDQGVPPMDPDQPSAEVSALFRIAVLGYKLPKSKVDTQAVAKLLAELGKIGSNVNQIAKHLNAGRR